MADTKGKMRLVICEGGSISYLLMRKSVKNVNLRIKPDGRVLVSANKRVPVAFIDDFIRQKQKYIFSAIARFEEKRKKFPVVPRQYVSGEKYVLLGKTVMLQVQRSEQESIKLEEGCLCMRVKDTDDFRHKENMLTEWLEEYRTEVFWRLIDEGYKKLKSYGVPYPRLRVRNMTSRWGSCRPDKGIITLNGYLIEAPERCIEYVILHEFVHFIHPNHSKQFWDFVAGCMPDWKERRKELEEVAVEVIGCQ